MTSPAGYHGKIPTKGDFIQRGLPVAFTRAWDRWLMEGIGALKQSGGDAWLDGYRTAPLWRFSIPAGAFGDQAMVGVLMASVDRVGRNFPLTIAVEAPPGFSAFDALLSQGPMLDRMAAAALAALSGKAKKDDLDAAVNAIAADPAAPAQIEDSAEALTVAGANPEGAIAARWLERRYGPDSAIFLSDAPPDQDRELIATRGTPEPALVARLFEGGSLAPLVEPAEDDLDLLAPMSADATAPVVAMAAATSAEPSSADDAEDDIDALIGGEPLAPLNDEDVSAAHSAPATVPADAPRAATDEEIEALIGSDPLSGEASNDPPSLRQALGADDDPDKEEDDPIAAILAGGGPES